MWIKQIKLILLMCATFITPSLNYANTLKSDSEVVYKIQYRNQVKQLLNQINPQAMWNNLTVLTNFPDRSARSQSGVNAALWIKDQAEMLAKKSGRDDVSVFTVETKGLQWGQTPYASDQPSIILKIGNSTEAGIVIGAHFDTQTKCGEEDSWCEDKGNMTGANDDGSGTVGVMEVARTILSSGLHFKKPIYLIWYAGEEQELWGSQAVIADFQKRNIEVSALMQLDQIGYAKNNDLTMYIASDKDLAPGKHAHVDHDLSLYLETLVKEYVDRPVVLSCEGGSDEEAWTDIANVKAARSLESNYCDTTQIYQDMHSSRDTMDKLSLEHMTDNLKLAIAFSVELAEPVTA